jgi:hypothetical protein
MATVSTNELRAIANKIFDHLDSLGRTEVDVPYDFYWAIPRALRYGTYEPPREFTVGQLSDDLKELRKILDGSSESFSYALVWLGTALQAIGEEVVI